MASTWCSDAVLCCRDAMYPAVHTENERLDKSLAHAMELAARTVCPCAHSICLTGWRRAAFTIRRQFEGGFISRRNTFGVAIVGSAISGRSTAVAIGRLGAP